VKEPFALLIFDCRGMRGNVMEFVQENARIFPLSIMVTWAIAGMFIGAVSGLVEKSRKKMLAGALFGFIGGAAGGFLGSVFYGSVMLEFSPKSWLSSRLAEGLSGGLVGAVMWFSIGFIEKLYVFRRREDPKLDKKICDSCGTQNPLRYWYCSGCGHVLQISAPPQKIKVTPFRGMERIINAIRFMSWLFGITGVITTPVIFFVFLMQDIFLAFIGVVFSILFTYLMVVGFRFLGDLLSCLIRISSNTKAENKQ
jgi:ribosomal protein L40E